AQAPGVEELLVDADDVVDDAGNADGVVRPTPLFAGQRDASGDRAVDIGEIPGFDVTVDPAGAGKHAYRVGELLFQIEAHAGPAGVGAHRVDVGGLPGDRRERDGVGEMPGIAAADKAGDLYLARLTPQIVALFDLTHQLELPERRVKITAPWALAAGRSH